MIAIIISFSAGFTTLSLLDDLGLSSAREAGREWALRLNESLEGPRGVKS